MPQCFEHSADTLMTFESSYNTYNSNNVPNSWVPSDSRKIWHIINDVPETKAVRVAKLAPDRGAGMVEITNGVLPNPYNTLPNDVYLQSLPSAVGGGSPLVANPQPLPSGPGSPAAAPSGLAVTSFEYTSASSSWLPAVNAIGYRVYVNNIAAPNLTPDMHHVTVGNFSPGSAGNTFSVTALSADGSESAQLNIVSSATKPLYLG
jgi:hypothetical protein